MVVDFSHRYSVRYQIPGLMLGACGKEKRKKRKSLLGLDRGDGDVCVNILELSLEDVRRADVTVKETLDLA